jgi:hypothetical protein
VDGAPEKAEDPENRERAVDVAIAEYNALRAEIVSHVTAQAALVGLALTAAGVILGFAVKEGGDQRLLLAIPPLTLLVVMLHTAENFRAALIGRYIATTLWPSLERQVGKLHSWEAGVLDRRKQPLHLLLPEIFLLDVPAMAILILASGYALTQVGGKEALWWIDWAVIGLSVLIPLGFAVHTRRESRLAAEQLRREESQ